MTQARVAVLLLLLPTLAACRTASLENTAKISAQESRLLGAWVGENGTSFEFAPDGRALWIFPGEETTDTFRIRYRYDPEAAPNHLDLFDFDRGPLAGRTLFCIAELMEADSFRLDCEPGTSEAVRPDDFTGQTQTFRRPAPG